MKLPKVDTSNVELHLPKAEIQDTKNKGNSEQTYSQTEILSQIGAHILGSTF